jgi:hypothetical protein
MISQELFDETVLENQDVFDLTPEQALEETLSQYSKLDLKHLSITHPHDEHQAAVKERLERKQFAEALSKLDECIQEDGSIALPCCPTTECITWLQTIQERCKSAPYLVLLLLQDGMYTLMNFFSSSSSSSSSSVLLDADVLLATISTLTVVLTPVEGAREAQSKLRDLMARDTIMEQWKKLYNHHHPSQPPNNQKSQLLQLACAACRGSEDNKKLWMKVNGVDSLLETLKDSSSSSSSHEEHTLLLVNATQLLTILCRFDDFREAKEGMMVVVEQPIIVSSAHDHALEFVQHGAVPILYKLATTTSSSSSLETISPILLESTMSALRVLAIQDATVQSMVAIGVLDLVETTLHSENCRVVAATLGLIRNLCANDDVKTTLCNDSILRGMMVAMEGGGRKNATVQEHACGTVAAMALRKPRNAVLIVEQHHGHLHVLAAMRQHGILVKRQGALALRNLVSRSPELKEVLLDAGAEEVLREAGTHQGCLDEAYAALRDLGCSVQVLQVKENGNTLERARTFGDSKPNFRPVFEPSKTLDA